MKNRVQVHTLLSMTLQCITGNKPGIDHTEGYIHSWALGKWFGVQTFDSGAHLASSQQAPPMHLSTEESYI